MAFGIGLLDLLLALQIRVSVTLAERINVVGLELRLGEVVSYET